ncbi:YczE/YyaS/YitT family protein [Bacillus benzoevorans]|uniref:YitT family protein n=1 Tax=Bacillus benzoevorans TaxID=1456 RepID=A0A7X0LWB5_9BACI|nr:YitT family protein [Bacillus benzoevorans]MBB6446891.1 hypothetical protein [Bacillus benzoevorans]
MKYIQYVTGIFILTLGIALTIQSDLGASPYDALLVGLFRTIGLTVGSWEIILALIIILMIAVLKRQRPVFIGLLTAVVTGIGIDFWLYLLPYFIVPEQVLSKLVCFLTGVILLGLGTAVYLYTHLAPAPLDHLMLVIRELTGKGILFSRTLIYLVSLTLAFLFNGPIGLGTVLTVFLGGPILNFFMVLMQKRQTELRAHEQMDAIS